MKVLVTGSNGRIGQALLRRLEHDITPFDLPDYDARNYRQLVSAAHGHDALIHLAWDTETDNINSNHHNPENMVQVMNVYKAAVEAGVGRVIMASSVHADTYSKQKPGELMDPYALPTPDSLYGAAKCMVEALGRYYAARHDLEVVCVRFGAVNSKDRPAEELSERQTWLSHEDCANLVDRILAAPTVPNNFNIVYAVSNNPDRVHDLSNTFGWSSLSS